MTDVLLDAWRTLARAALAAEADSLAAWLRLSMVSRAWREALAGVHSLCMGCPAHAQLRIYHSNACGSLARSCRCTVCSTS